LNIGLGPFASVLNADNPFSGRDLLATTMEELMKVYKLDKKPAKKIIVERNKAMAYLHVKPKKKQKVQIEIGRPFGVVHILHVEFVPGKGLKGLPKEWKDQLHASSESSVRPSPRKRDSKKRDSSTLRSTDRDSKRMRKADPSNDVSVDDVMKWSVARVGHWLRRIHLPIFIPDFEFAGINGRMLMTTPYPELLDVLNVELDTLSEKLVKNISLLRASNKRSKGLEEKENKRLSNFSTIEIRSSFNHSF